MVKKNLSDIRKLNKAFSKNPELAYLEFVKKFSTTKEMAKKYSVKVTALKHYLEKGEVKNANKFEIPLY